MVLQLIGHEYKYAVEQIMLSLFPSERPVYDSSVIEAMSATTTLKYTEYYANATTVIQRGNDVSRGITRVRRSALTDEIAKDRNLQRIIKQSFFQAAACFVETPPVWGSLTGIRPAQIAAALLSGKGYAAARKFLTQEYKVASEQAELCLEAALAALTLKRSVEPGDIAFYVGIPFCPSRCAYCSFVSNSVEKSFGMIESFSKALLREIDLAAKLIKALKLRVISVYVGGGTPTALPIDDFEALLRTLKDSIDLSSIREYTVEAGRPDTITGQKLNIMRRSGVKRVCVNPQSMSRKVLEAIGRKHTPEDAAHAVRLVRQSGMALNMDVIAGLPYDTPRGFGKTLDTVLDFSPENLTVHTLSLKKGSRIMLENTAKPSGADVAAMHKYASQRLREYGFSPYYLYKQKFASGGYENVGWCLPGHEGIYNICMMEELCTVLGLGGGAVTKLVSPGGRIERIFNAKYPREYIMDSDDSLSDKMMNKYDRIRNTIQQGE